MKSYKDIVNREFKVKKKKSYIAIIGIFLGVMLLSAVLNFFSFENKRYQNESRAGGEYELIYEYDEASGDIRDKISKNVYVDSLGFYKEREVSINDKEVLVIDFDDVSINDFYKYGLSLVNVDLGSLKENEVYISDILAAQGYKVGDEIEVEGEKYIVKDIFSFNWKVEAIFKKYTPKVGDKSNLVVGVKGDRKTIVDNMNSITEASNYEIKNGYASKIRLKNSDKMRTNEQRLSVFYGLNNIMALVQLLVVIVIILITVVSSYGLVNFSIADKRKQFGILRCIGASPGQIRALIYKEVFMLGVQAVIPAIIVGHIISYGLINYLSGKEIFNSYGLSFSVNIPSIIVVLLISLLTIFLASIMPAIKASKVTPIESTKGILGNQKIQKIGFLSRFIRKRFGIESEIAYRNLKTNKSMFYASTILLVVCFVSFVTLSFVTDNYVSSYKSGVISEYDYGINLNTNFDMHIKDYKDSKYENEIKGMTKEEIKEFTRDKGEEFIKMIKKDRDEVVDFLEEYTTGEAGISSNSIHVYKFLFEGLSLDKEEKLDGHFIEEVAENKFKSSGGILVYNEEYFNLMKKHIRGNFTYEEFKKDGVILVDNIKYTITPQISKLFDNKKGDKITMHFKSDEGKDIDAWGENNSLEEFEKVADQKIDMTVMGSIKLTDNMLTSGNISDGIVMIVSEEFFNEYAGTIKASDLRNDYFYNDISFNLKEKVDPILFENLLISKFNGEQESNVYLRNNVKERKAIMEIDKIVKVVLYGFLTMVISILVMSVLINKKMSIESRRKEYGGLLAIGMDRDKISKTILYEGLIQSIIVFAIAIPLTLLINKAINYFMGGLITLEPLNIWFWIVSIIAVIIVTFMTSLLPLSMFKKLDIISMIKGEE